MFSLRLILGQTLLIPLDRSQPLFYFVPQDSHSQAGSTRCTPMWQDLVEAAATTPGHALSVKYDEKLNGAEELCRRQGMAFFPLAAETFGWWHRVGEREVKKLGSDTRDRRRARLSTTSGVVWQFCCSGATLRFWETGFPTSHYHKLMDYISEKKYDLFSRCTVPDTI